MRRDAIPNLREMDIPRQRDMLSWLAALGIAVVVVGAMLALTLTN